MPNELFSLLFPFHSVNHSVLSYHAFFCLELILCTSSLLFSLLLFYLHVYYPIFRAKFLFQLPWSLSLLSLEILHLFFSPFVWNLLCAVVHGHIFLNIYALLFLNDSKGILGEGNGSPLQYSCLENPMDRGAW